MDIDLPDVSARSSDVVVGNRWRKRATNIRTLYTREFVRAAGECVRAAIKK